MDQESGIMDQEGGSICPLCSRPVDAPPGEPVPEHLDGLVGKPCPTSGWTLPSFLAHHEALDVPMGPP